MVSASQYLRNHPKTHHVYDAMFRDSMKFQYPLSSLLIYDIPHKITGASYYQVNYGLDLLYFIGVLLFGPLCARILLELLKQPRFETMNFNSQRNKFLLYVLMFALTFVCVNVCTHLCLLSHIAVIRFRPDTNLINRTRCFGAMGLADR